MPDTDKRFWAPGVRGPLTQEQYDRWLAGDEPFWSGVDLGNDAAVEITFSFGREDPKIRVRADDEFQPPEGFKRW